MLHNKRGGGKFNINARPKINEVLMAANIYIILLMVYLSKLNSQTSR